MRLLSEEANPFPPLLLGVSWLPQLVKVFLQQALLFQRSVNSGCPRQGEYPWKSHKAPTLRPQPSPPPGRALYYFVLAPPCRGSLSSNAALCHSGLRGELAGTLLEHGEGSQHGNWTSSAISQLVWSYQLRLTHSPSA